MKRLFGFVFLVGALLWVLAAPAAAVGWHFEVLDGDGGPNGSIDAYVGEDAAVTLYGGQPHTWYADAQHGDLRHAWWNGTQWFFETLDGAGGTAGRIDAYVGYGSAVTLYGGQPHVWYTDTTNANLRHAWWSGTQWNFETLDGEGGSNGRIDANVGYKSEVTIYGGQPHVWYSDAQHGTLRHAWWTGTQWSFETLDGAGGTNGRIDAFVGSTSSVTLYGGQPHAWYRDDTNADLRHAWWTGTQWNFETLDGAGGTNGRIDSEVGEDAAVTLYGGQPHLWYYDVTHGDQRHAWWNGASWFFETLDGAGGAGGRVDADVGKWNAVTLYGGEPHVWYYDWTNGDQRHAWWNGARWFFETLDGAGGSNGRVDSKVGFAQSAVSLYGGQPHVWYSDDTNGHLRHAWWG